MKVSVITVAFNAAAMLERTVCSVLGQTGVDFEYVIVDGASTDHTLEMLRRYKEQLAFLLSEPDSGIYDAMNKGVRLASGDCLLFMNAGDSFADDRSLYRLVAAMDSNGVREQVVWGGWLVQSAQAVAISKKPDLPRGLFNHQATIYSRSIHSWHGEYACVSGLTAADFVFFRTLQASKRVDFRTIAHPVAVIDPFGTSAGLQTYLQRVLVDTLCGYEGRYLGAAKMVFHPAYHRLKRMLKIR